MTTTVGVDEASKVVDSLVDHAIRTLAAAKEIYALNTGAVLR